MSQPEVLEAVTEHDLDCLLILADSLAAKLACAL
jgi:hypothetical protein